MIISPWIEQLAASSASPRVIAHRGDAFRAPENTIDAAELAFQSGAFAWELDVHLSSDGVPVVIHDESLLRTTDVGERFSGDPRGVSGFPVSQFLLEELQSLDAGSWFLSANGGSRSAGGFNSLGRVPKEIVDRCAHSLIRIPTLREALQVTKQWKWWVNVEIKSFPKPPPLVQMTMEAVCILKGEKPDWDTAKKMLGESSFMTSLQEFDKVSTWSRVTSS